QGPFIESHVADGDVFGFAVRKHDMSMPARRDENSRGDAGDFRRKEVVTADAYEIVAEEVVNQIIEPVIVVAAIGRGEGDDFARGGGNAGIAGGGKALVGLADITDLRIPRDEFLGFVRRAVVHY